MLVQFCSAEQSNGVGSAYGLLEKRSTADEASWRMPTYRAKTALSEAKPLVLSGANHCDPCNLVFLAIAVGSVRDPFLYMT